MKVKFEGGPLDGLFRELPDGADHFYAQRLADPTLFAPNSPLHAQTVEYRPAYVVFAEVQRGH